MFTLRKRAFLLQFTLLYVEISTGIQEGRTSFQAVLENKEVGAIQGAKLRQFHLFLFQVLIYWNTGEDNVIEIDRSGIQG